MRLFKPSWRARTASAAASPLATWFATRWERIRLAPATPCALCRDQMRVEVSRSARRDISQDLRCMRRVEAARVCLTTCTCALDTENLCLARCAAIRQIAELNGSTSLASGSRPRRRESGCAPCASCCRRTCGRRSPRWSRRLMPTPTMATMPPTFTAACETSRRTVAALRQFASARTPGTRHPCAAAFLGALAGEAAARAAATGAAALAAGELIPTPPAHAVTDSVVRMVVAVPEDMAGAASARLGESGSTTPRRANFQQNWSPRSRRRAIDAASAPSRSRSVQRVRGSTRRISAAEAHRNESNRRGTRRAQYGILGHT
mmetsp:Transcript_31177/g.72521  ORF Transcript_31177/g.72521 Transcript_31177/m.72521 type:complete len:320 (+) Transcript_31177:567-1526(+)